VTVERSERLPAASYASTDRLYDVPHVSPENVAVVAGVSPAALGPTKSPYPATPTLSVDAFHASEIVDGVDAVIVSPVGFDGGWASEGAGPPGGGHGAVDACSDVFAERLPAASAASIWIR
jgi:hypothetical protein